MPTQSSMRSWPGIVFAVLVIVFALGNAWLGLYPFGRAVWIRPILASVGIIGAVCLLRGNGWWRILLPAWALPQTWVIATDISREWFYQGLSLTKYQSSWAKHDELLVEYKSSGINGAGLILLGVILALAYFQLHPPIRRHPLPKRRTLCVAAALAVAVVCFVGLRNWRERSALFVLDLDLPKVPIYHQDKLLGRTPLRFTPESIQDWGLPLDLSKPLHMDGTGWADCVVIDDGKAYVPLYAGTPWPFEQYMDAFESPWGTRYRMHVSGERRNRRSGYMFPRPALRNQPIMTLELLGPQSIPAGSPLRVRCVLTNPTTRSFAGHHADLSRMCFNYVHRQYIPAPEGVQLRRQITMPETWNALPAGAMLSADIEFDAPYYPGDYSFFCTWFLYRIQNDNRGEGTTYSNIVRLQVQ